MSLLVDVLQYGSGSHTTSSEAANALATDLVSDGVVGALTNTTGVSPSTGGFAVNAQGSPDTTVAVTAGIAYATGTPTSQGSQRLRVKLTANQNITISGNATGGTRFDWVYIKLDPTNMANPNAAADNVATLVTSRSTSSSVDNGAGVSFGYCIAVITVANGFTSITNGNIADKRVQSGAVNAALASIPATALQVGAITLGYAQITSNFTTASTSFVQVTGLTATVTIPAGGRKIKITAFASSLAPGGGFSQCVMSLWDGTVGSGTELNEAVNNASTSAASAIPGICMAVVTPATGSKTYNVGLKSASTSATITASSTAPAFILVEAI